MENENASTSEALTAIARARAAAADRLVTPWWYHPILGALLAGQLVAFSFGGTLVRLAGLAVLLAGIAVLVRAYTRLTGVWISGYDAGPASRWAYAMGAVTAVCFVISFLVARTTSLVWPTWCLAAVVLLGVVVLGHRFDAALRAQLRAGA